MIKFGVILRLKEFDRRLEESNTMLKNLNLTFGPEKQLQEIIENNKDRQMVLLESVTDSEKFALLDISNEESIFHSQLDYRIYHTINLKEWNGFFEFRYVTLDTEQQKIFNAHLGKWDDPFNRPVGLKSTLVGHDERKDYEFLMINIWEDQEDYVEWENESDNEFREFGHGGNAKALVAQYKLVKNKE